MKRILFLVLFLGCQGPGQPLEPVKLSKLGPAATPIVHYAFEEGSGRVLVDSVNGFNGTAVRTSYKSGPVGNFSLHFNYVVKSGANITAALPALSEIESGSISLWFAYGGIPEGLDVAPILYFGRHPVIGLFDDHLVIEIGHPLPVGNRHLYFTVVRNDAVALCFDSSLQLPAGIPLATWFHFVVSVDSAGNRAYLNGQRMYNRNFNAGTDSLRTEFFADVLVQNVFAFGWGTFGDSGIEFMQSLFGRIDQVKIFGPETLTDAEVLDLFNEGGSINKDLPAPGFGPLSTIIDSENGQPQYDSTDER